MADEPSPKELERLISRNHSETSADILDLKSQLTANVSTLLSQFDKYVLTKVYEADERARNAVNSALVERVKRLEDNESKTRFGNRAAIAAGVVAVLGSLAAIVFTNLTKG